MDCSKNGDKIGVPCIVLEMKTKLGLYGLFKRWIKIKALWIAREIE